MLYYLDTTMQYEQYREAAQGQYYVDKSMMIEKVSTRIHSADKYICITRPRRFGKTINANMLGAYYTIGCDSTALFQNMKIANSPNYGHNQNKHHVIHIDFSRMPDICTCYKDYISMIIDGLAADLREAYPALAARNYASVSRMFYETGDSFIFIMDEWDSCFYKPFMTRQDRTAFLGFLKNLLKDQPYVELAYMTGVLPIAKYSSGSELNMFSEYNFMGDCVFDEYFGFHEQEVRQLCAQNKQLTYEELAYWYDGYYTAGGWHIFNPRSVCNALMNGTCMNYWTQTGPMNEIADCIEANVDEVREDIVKLVAGIPVEAQLQGYSAEELSMATRNEILSAMVVYGFLTYHDGQLAIPNHELMEKFQMVLCRDSMGAVKEIVDSSKLMLEATLAGDEQKVAELLESVHDREIPFLQYHDENSLSCVITLCYLYARKDYEIIREAKSGKGYCDYLFLPRKRDGIAIILELKFGKSCEEAIAQIKSRNYIERVSQYASVLLVGINYDKEKRHTCRIEKI